MKHPIAEKELIACHPDGARQRVKIQIGRPFRLERYEWAVSVHLDGLYHSLPDVHGQDSFEALSLSYTLLHRLLGEFVEDGGQLLEKDGKTPFDPGFPAVQWNTDKLTRTYS